MTNKKGRNKLLFRLLMVLALFSILLLGSCKYFDLDSLRPHKTTSATTTEEPTTTIVPTTAPITTIVPTTNLTTTTPTTDTTTTTTEENTNLQENVIFDDFQIHFIELGNSYAGDSTYIKIGDIDILIDAGSRKGSAPTIKKYLDQYVTDGKLEYVIATHAHQDHIAAFIGSKSGNTRDGIFYQYEVGTLIDFALTNATTALYDEYKDARNYLIDNGTIHYTAAQCFNEEDGAQATIQFNESSSMTILYNDYYFYESSDENNYSVCTLFTYESDGIERNFLLTGDLEEDGEESMASYYSKPGNPTLPHCELFKAGHHGSKTSSNDCLLSLITPEVCVVCCCAGTTEYTKYLDNTFPTRDFINRIAVYTDKVYVTSLYDDETKEFGSMNGDIILSVNGKSFGIWASNNLTKLKDTEWISHTVYVDSTGKIVTKDTVGAIERPCRVLPSQWQKE